jgi:hypothetical protein
MVLVGLMVWTGTFDVFFINLTTEGVCCRDAKVSGDTRLPWRALLILLRESYQMLKPWHDTLDPALCRIQSEKL